MRRRIITIFTYISTGILPLIAQKSNEFYKIDKIALQIPDSLTHSTSGISEYFNDQFSVPSEKSRAVFVWISQNMSYDIENMFALNFYQNPKEIIDKVLIERKGICMHYAELFSNISNRMGIKTYVISGYTKQNGFVDYIPHVWCVSLIDSTWYLFDPTWGSGYVQNSKFIKKINNFYFKTKPEQLIKSHMPFDPLWQFLNYPVSNQEFYEGKTSINKNKPFFNFKDTLARFEKQSEIEKLSSSNIRIKQNGVKNALIFDRLQHNTREIEYYNNKIIIELYNNAVNLYNDGINQLNRFIDYRNRQFTPKKSDEEIRQMVELAALTLVKSREKLNEIQKPDANTASSILQLSRAIEESTINVNEQKSFVEKYIATKKIFRKSLFYK